MDSYTWDFGEFGFGSVGSFEVLDSWGTTVSTSFSTYDDINFSVRTEETYYVKITGSSSFSTEQYSVVYKELAVLNSPAVFFDPVYSGTLSVGETIDVNVQVFDADGVPSYIGTGWILVDDEGNKTYLDESSPSLELDNAWSGSSLYFYGYFTDNAGFFEHSYDYSDIKTAYYIGEISAANNKASAGTIDLVIGEATTKTFAIVGRERKLSLMGR